MKHKILSAILPLSILALASCADDPTTTTGSTTTDVDSIAAGPGGDVRGIYVLNEGNMGADKCTLDYYDYVDAKYYRNIYAENNPNEPLELGDAGSDMAIHDNRLFIVVSGSHKVEVLDALTTKRIGHVDVSSPRSVAFCGDDVYVSSWIDGVVRFNVNTLSITGRCAAGVNPEEMVVCDSTLYVANSYDYTSGIYDGSISVIDLRSFTKTGSIETGVNLRHLALDEFDNMWATDQGNYGDVPSALIRLQRGEDGKYTVKEKLPYGCANLAIGKGTLCFYDQTYDENWNATYSFNTLKPTETGYIDLKRNFITDGTETTLDTPYALAVQPSTGDIFITDAKNYTSSGRLRCYSAAGKQKWEVVTGDIPGHIAFLMKH